MQKPLLYLLLFSLLFVSCRSVTNDRLALEQATRAMEELKLGNSKEAALLLREAVRLDSDSVRYRYNLGIALLQDHQYDQVIKLADESFSMFEHQIRFLLLKAKALTEMEQYQQALEEYQRLFALNPGSYILQAEVMQQALSWGFDEKAKSLANRLILVSEYQEEAFAVLASLDEEQLWYADVLNYLKKEVSTTDPSQPQLESKPEDEPSSAEASGPPEQ